MDDVGPERSNTALIMNSLYVATLGLIHLLQSKRGERSSIVAADSIDRTKEIPRIHWMTEEESREMKENLARKHFDMSLDEFFGAWKAGKFDDDRERHGEVISLAMMIPEAWEKSET